MTELHTKYAPEECVRRLRDALAEEWGQRQPVLGWAIGWTFRLHQTEPKRYSTDTERIRCIFYGRIYAHGMGSKIKVWDFPGAWDPLAWAVHLPVLMILLLTWGGGTPEARLLVLLFELTGIFLLYQSYQHRQGSYHRQKQALRRFIQLVLLADGSWNDN